MFMDELVPFLTHRDISEQTIRNRIDSLKKGDS